ncbi:hypothetical protein GCM10028825_38310 [Spirosoma agri]
MLTLGKEESLWGPMQYSTLHGELRTYQDGVIVKGYSWPNVIHRLNGYKECRPTSPDTVLYRLYALKPYQFWDYVNYSIEPRWRLPYLDPAQIQPPLNPKPPTLCPPNSPDYPQPESFYKDHRIPIPAGAPILK